MKQIFKSGISPLLLLLTFIPFAICLFFTFYPTFIWQMLVILTIPFLFSCFLIFRTYYVIDEQERLIIFCGFRYATISIANIKSIKKSNSILAAPAASLNRIEICYNKKRVDISPKDKSRFIDALLNINPSIEVGDLSI